MEQDLLYRIYIENNFLVKKLDSLFVIVVDLYNSRYNL